MRLSAIPKIKVDEALIGKILFLGKFLKILDGIFVEPNSDLLLQLFGVWVFDGFGKVVVITHVCTLHKFCVPAYQLCERR